MKYLQKLIFITSINLFCLYCIGQNTYTVQSDINSVRQKFTTLTNSDTYAQIRFRNATTGQYFTPQSVIITEKSTAQIYQHIARQDSNAAERAQQTDNKILREYTIHGGTVKFRVKEHCDYIISVKDPQYSNAEISFNWLELIGNNVVIANVSPILELMLNGVVTADGKYYQKTELVITYQDEQTRQLQRASFKPDGTCELLVKFGAQYLLKIKQPSSKEVSFDLEIPSDIMLFRPVTLKSGLIELYLDIAPENKPVSATPAIREEANTENAEDFFLKNSGDLHFTKGQTFKLSNYQFDYQAHILTDKCMYELDLLTQILKSRPGVKISIRVYTDARGNNEYNTRLTKEIAEKMVSYIAGKGINRSRLLGLGMGSEQTNQLNNMDKDHIENHYLASRKAEIQILSM
ncbi:MAG TPA: OmpA family protein [Saprospiraceae bacterium]|nr:OmpA family protein [Saprospiraceae bacterium]